MSVVTRRRLVAALGATAVVITTAGPAWAASVTQPSTGATNNTQTAVRVTVSNVSVNSAVLGTQPTVTLDNGPTGSQTYSGSNVTVTGSSVAATFDLAPTGLPLAAPGSYTVDICGQNAPSCVNGVSEDKSATLTVTGAAATVSAVSPASAYSNNTAISGATITGTGFSYGDTVAFLSNGVKQAGITFTPNYAGSSATTLSGTLQVGLSVPPGAYDVEVDHANGTKGTPKTGAFTVEVSPGLASFANAVGGTTVGQGATSYAVTLTGTDLQTDLTGSSFTFTDSASNPCPVNTCQLGITAGGPTTDTTTKIVVPLTVPSNEYADTASTHHTLVITGDHASESIPFTVTPAPAVTGATYQQGQNSTGGGAYSFSVSNLQSGASASFDPSISSSSTPNTGAGTISLSDVSVPATTAAKTYPVTVVNPDGGTGSATNGLTVTAAPTVTKVSPVSFGRGANNEAITITGTGFGTKTTTGGSGKPTVELLDGGSAAPETVAVSSVSKDGTTITGTITVPSDAPLDSLDVVVENPDLGTSAPATSALSITSFEISSLSPSSNDNGPDASSVPVTVNATKLTPGDTYDVTFVPDNAPANVAPIVVSGVAAAPASAGAPYTIPVTVDFENAAPTSYDVVVTDVSDSTDTARSAGAFIVTAFGSPTATGLSPATFATGGTGTLTFNGAFLYDGATISITPEISGDPAFTLDPSTLTWQGGNSVSETVTAPANGKVGDKYDVVVTNTDGGQTVPLVLTLTAPPTVTSVSPASLAGAGNDSNGNRTITVTGTGFESGATVELVGPASSTAVTQLPTDDPSVDGKTITADVPANAFSAGAYRVAVVSPDYGTSAASDGSTLTITPVATALTVTQSATKLVYGKTATVSGVLSAADGTSLTGRTVTIYETVAGTNVAIGSAKTGSNGAYSVTLPIPYSGVVKAAFPGAAGTPSAPAGFASTLGTTGAVTVVYETLTRSTTTVSHTQPQVITGVVSPGFSGVAVSLHYVDAAGKTHTLVTTTTDSNGHYRLADTLGRGKYTLFVVAAGTARNAGTASSRFTVTRA